jgi:hypothetical protein
MTALRLLRLRRFWGLSGPVANILAHLAYGEGHE